MATLSQVRSKINTELLTLTGSGKPLAFVYDSYTTDIEGYPCVMFEPDSTKSELLDIHCNTRTYSFMMYCMQDMTSVSRDTALDRLVDIFDSICNLFDDNYTLDGLCIKVETMGGDRDQVETESGFVLLVRIPIICTTLHETGT